MSSEFRRAAERQSALDIRLDQGRRSKPRSPPRTRFISRPVTIHDKLVFNGVRRTNMQNGYIYVPRPRGDDKR
jgi:hypothetical protein